MLDVTDTPLQQRTLLLPSLEYREPCPKQTLHPQNMVVKQTWVEQYTFSLVIRYSLRFLQCITKIPALLLFLEQAQTPTGPFLPPYWQVPPLVCVPSSLSIFRLKQGFFVYYSPENLIYHLGE